MFEVSVHGLGTVGLPLAAALAHDLTVLGVESDGARREQIASTQGPLLEPGLRDAVDHALSEGRLTLSERPGPAPVHLLCLPTPLGDTGADLHAVFAAVDALGPHFRPGDLVCLESTCPPGTVARIAARIQAPGVLWASAPERVLPGRALVELKTVDRVVGGLTEAATHAAVAFYSKALGVRVHPTDAATASAAKLVENAARYVQIALANELHALAAASGADPRAALALARTHPRVDLLQPGIGVGGHCLPVDPEFLVQAAPDQARLIPAAREADHLATERALAAIRARAAALGPSPLIALLGAAYKPQTADLRHSPALRIARALRDEGHRIVVADPRVLPPSDLPWDTPEGAVARADLVVFLVAHPELCALATRGPELDLCGARS